LSYQKVGVLDTHVQNFFGCPVAAPMLVLISRKFLVFGSLYVSAFSLMFSLMY